MNILKFINALDRKGIFLDLKSTSAALRVLRNPHFSFPSVHVAGTNGKGSAVVMLSSVLRSAGFRVGTFTSPHLIDIRERMKINGKNISKVAFAKLAKRLKKITEGHKISLSHFEFLTVMGFVYFAQEKVDIAVIEVGLGGRLDATNVLRALVSVITSIGKDHERFLGTRLIDITNEKAGIIKRGGVVVSTVTQARLQKRIKDISAQKRAHFISLGSHFNVWGGRNAFHYRDKDRRLTDIKLSLSGRFQRRNAAAVIATVGVLNEKGYKVSEKALRAGLANTVWPGRLEMVQSTPKVLLDSAHNVAGIKALIDALDNDYDYERLHFVVGMMEDKAYRAMLTPLLDRSTSLTFVEPSVRRALKGEKLLMKVPEFRGKIRCQKEIRDVLPSLVKKVGPKDMICVTGSFYTVSEAKGCFL